MMLPSDAMPSAAQTAILVQLAERLENLRHGERGGAVAAAAAAMRVSVQTVHRWLTAYRAPARRQRADAGATGLTSEEAQVIASIMSEGGRDNGKRIDTLKNAVRWARANGRIRAERVDTATGELIPLTDSAISRALRHYNLHPDQLRQPRPHQALSSPHPNWCWQVDASVCVLYYLPMAGNGVSGHGLVRLNRAVHYKNRPENIQAIEKFRVIRYVATDHCSGTIRVRYYPHAESGSHTVEFLAWLMAPKQNPADPFHGAPNIVMVDPGATAAGMVRRFCEALDIQLVVNEPHNPRAKGQVEQAQNLWETVFESGLRFIADRVRDFGDLNALADKFQLHFNATEKHTRHGKTRFDKWLEIKPDQLRVTAPAEQLLRLATGKIVTPEVSGDLTVRFDGRVWNVRAVPGVTIGGTVRVCLSPFVEGGAVAVCRGEDGRVMHLPLAAVEAGEHGFAANAATIGLEYKSPPDTAASANAKSLAMLASGTTTLRDDAAARRKKPFVPFDGAFNPFVEAETAPSRHYLPRMGTALETAVAIPDAAPRMLKAPRAAMLAREALGTRWTAEMYEFITRRYAEGVSEEALAQQIARWRQSDVQQEVQ